MLSDEITGLEKGALHVSPQFLMIDRYDVMCRLGPRGILPRIHAVRRVGTKQNLTS